MKAFEIREFGLDKLTLAERPEPQPGEGQVLIRLRAASLNYRDVRVVEGTYNPRMRLPMVPLSDGAGEVVKTGAKVDRVKVGDRVASAFMPEWTSGEIDDKKARSALGGGIDGVAVEYIVLPQDALVVIPEYLSYEDAATLPCAGVTAWNALVNSGHLRPNETVLVLGSGGVSVFALQFAKLMHARVIATSSSDAKLARLKELGADEGINYNTSPEWDKVVREMTNGRGVDHVIEVGGENTLPKSMKAVRAGGHISVIGLLSGAGAINFVPVFMRSLRLQGLYVGSREMFDEMVRAMTQHQLRPVIDRVFPFEELPEALRYMGKGQHFGKICLKF